MTEADKASRKLWIASRVEVKKQRKIDGCCYDCGDPSVLFRCDRCLDVQSIKRQGLAERKASGWYWRGKWRVW